MGEGLSVLADSGALHFSEKDIIIVLKKLLCWLSHEELNPSFSYTQREFSSQCYKFFPVVGGWLLFPMK